MSASDRIQFLYREIMSDPAIMNNFALEDRLNFSHQKQSDELLDLMDELAEHIKIIIDTKLTMRQKQVMNMIYFQQMTQTEIANELGLCQPSIHKSIFGNRLYGAVRHKRYGGAIKKIQKLCATDENIITLLKKIEVLKQELY